MKKSLIILPIFILLFSSLIFAVEFEIKEEFNQGETLLAKISGNFINPILKENIFFYRDHVRIPVNFYDVAKINDEFYIYAQLLGKQPNNYSIIIENTKYMKGGQISEENIVKNFSVMENFTDFSIEPGFILTKDDFFIEVQNLQETKIIIQINPNANTSSSSGESTGFFASLFGETIKTTTQGENSITLKSGEIKKIYFAINVKEPIFKTLELSTQNTNYKIPVYIFAEKTIPVESEKEFYFDPQEFNLTLETNSKITKTIYIHNNANKTYENISLSISDSLSAYLSLSINEIQTLEKNSSVQIDLYFSSTNQEEIISGEIIATDTKDFSTTSLIYLELTKEPVIEEEKEIPEISKTCLENNGLICNKTQECTGKEINAKDDKCCLDVCNEKKTSNVGKIIGWILVTIMLGFAIWFFNFRKKKTRKSINLLNTASEFLEKSKRTPK